MQADLSILDEIDSGLDIDALREVATAVSGLRKADTATLMVTHYQVAGFGPPGACERLALFLLAGREWWRVVRVTCRGC